MGVVSSVLYYAVTRPTPNLPKQYVCCLRQWECLTTAWLCIICSSDHIVWMFVVQLLIIEKKGWNVIIINYDH